jgi:hypothetical protein
MAAKFEPIDILTGKDSGSPDHPKAWLVSEPGATARICHLISADSTRIGRAPDNELVIQGSDCVTVSLHHLVIERAVMEDRPAFRIHDLESTNGTFVNGGKISESILEDGARIQLGSQGPELSFVLKEPATLELDRTTTIPAEIVSPVPSVPAALNTYDLLLTDAVKRARRARAHGMAGQTMTIMRETLDHALRRSSRRFRVAIGVLVIGLLGVSGGAAWKIVQLNHEKQAIDRHIEALETKIEAAANADQADRLITEIDAYEAEGKQLQDNFLYRFGHREHDLVTDEIRRLLAEFGAETYSVPPEFTERVKHYIQQYQGPDRPLMVKALGASAGKIETMRDVLEEQHLPGDLSYMPLVESALQPARSRAGAVGLWQLTPATAKAYGLHVGSELDERTNVAKSTRAACRYLRELILDFGAGSSTLLALAAYNSGPSKVKQAIQAVSDPIKQRNFWYLYRVHALPLETREYVPKVIAAMIIARNPQRFGF